MALNFPNSPSINDTYTYSGKTWKWDGSVWLPQSSLGYTKNTFTATASQTTFEVTYTVGYVEVYLNGAKLSVDDYTATNGTSVVLSVGAVDGDLVEIISWQVVGLTPGYVPVTGGTFTGDVAFGGAIDEKVYTLSGTSAALDPSNGTIQTHTLTGATTYTDSVSEGESITLMIDDGAAYTINWPTITWVNNGGSVPTLATSGYTTIQVWKVSTTLYGALIADGT
jgi:hypothetical protein